MSLLADSHGSLLALIYLVRNTETLENELSLQDLEHSRIIFVFTAATVPSVINMLFPWELFVLCCVMV
jgi:hypothetical protein